MPPPSGVARPPAECDNQPRLETAGNYPHNGLSDLSFDFHGGLMFGIGENLVAGDKLVGAGSTVRTIVVGVRMGFTLRPGRVVDRPHGVREKALRTVLYQPSPGAGSRPARPEGRFS